MNWYLIHTKPRQEMCALQNLEQQGYKCFLPVISSEKLQQGLLTFVEEPLFPRYLFICLDQGHSAQSWSPIRSTKGVNRLVRFGIEPAKVDERMIDMLRTQKSMGELQPQRFLEQGERVVLTDGAFSGIEGIYQMKDGERRVMILIELLSKPVQMSVNLNNLRKVG